MELENLAAQHEAAIMKSRKDELLRRIADEIASGLACESDDAKDELFEFNKQALARAMLEAGFTSVTVRYSGCGDSGQTDSVDFEPAALDPSVVEVEMAQVRADYDQAQRAWKKELCFPSVTLPELASLLCDTAISLTGHDGWENNDGGEGTFTLQAEGAAAELEHSDFYVERDTSMHAL